MNTPPTDPKTRRTFIKESAAGTITAGATFPGILSAASNTQTLRVGLVGCGGRGTSAAINAMRADENTVVVALGDVFADQLEKSLGILEKAMPEQTRVEKSHCFQGFDSYQKVIESDVDVVLLATPPAFRPQHLKSAIEAGKHVFAECIAAVDAPGIRSFLKSAELAESQNLGILSGLCWRYDNSARAAQEKIQEGAIGGVRTVYATFYREDIGKRYRGSRKPEWSELEWQLRAWPDFQWLGGDLCVGLCGGHSVDNSPMEEILSIIVRLFMNTKTGPVDFSV